MKFCRDCTVKLALKGLGDRHGEVQVPLIGNDGESIILSASHDKPEAEINSVLFIGKDVGEMWEFEFPGRCCGSRVLLGKDSNVTGFEVKIDVIFDPAAQENEIRVVDSRVSVRIKNTAGLDDRECYVICNGQPIIGIAPFCHPCDGLLLKCY